MTKAPKISVVYFPGNNCEVETAEAARIAGLDASIVRWNTKENLANYAAFIIPGGWAYEDRIRAGVIPAKDPIMEKIKLEAEKGKPVLGICNGAQVLIETGMVPGLRDKVEFALAPNRNPFISGYYNAWVYLKHVQKKARTVFTDFDEGMIFKVPVAHGEGRFISKEKGIVKQMQKNNQIVFQYSDQNGNISGNFPVNPNGAMLNIAALSNKQGNIMAIMPHPERAVWQWQLQEAPKGNKTTTNREIFKSLYRHLIA